jgi:DNA-binding CsgD family transcriptional regulator
MWRTALVYGALLAAGAFGLRWLEFQFLVRSHAVETYAALIAFAFLGLGIWVGRRLFRSAPPQPFAPNVQAQQSLGVSEREFEVLLLLAQGKSNKQIANQLEVSPNTVKSHVASLFAKLAVARRTEAIHRARELGMIR